MTVKPIAEQVKEIIKHKRKKSLDYSIKDGMGYSAMVGFGENYFPAYGIALKANNTEIALLSSVSHLIGSSFQLWSAKIVDKLKSRKKVILFSAIMQALTFLPTLIIPFIFKNNAVLALIIFVALYNLFGNFISPPWNSLMGDLVADNQRGSFFGRRSKIIGITIFLSFLAGGFILERFHDDKIFIGFAIIFFLACIARFISAYFLKQIYEPTYEPTNTKNLSFKEFVSKLPYSPFGKFTAYLFIINFAVYISNPFFIVYMFRTLQFSYLEFTIAIALNVIVTYSAMYYWGKNSDIFGNKKILTITGWLIPLNPLLWLLPYGFWWICIVQMWTGFVWAGFQISSSNFIFDNVERERRAKMISYYNFLMGIGIFLGATIGGLLATYVFISPWIFLSNVQILFLISGIIRLLASINFIRMLREVREVKAASDEKLFVDLVAIRPMQKLAAETAIGIYSIKYAGEKSVEVGKKLIENAEKLIEPKQTRMMEIEEVLHNVDFSKRKQKEKELLEMEKGTEEHKKQKMILKKQANRKDE